VLFVVFVQTGSYNIPPRLNSQQSEIDPRGYVTVVQQLKAFRLTGRRHTAEQDHKYKYSREHEGTTRTGMTESGGQEQWDDRDHETSDGNNGHYGNMTT
jgi:hypothetical protein